jgi:hypothetical protein
VARDRVIQRRVHYLENWAELSITVRPSEYRPGWESQSRTSLKQDAFKERLKSGNRTSGISKKVKMNQSKGRRPKRAEESVVSAAGCRCEVEDRDGV